MSCLFCCNGKNCPSPLELLLFRLLFNITLLLCAFSNRVFHLKQNLFNRCGYEDTIATTNIPTDNSGYTTTSAVTTALQILMALLDRDDIGPVIIDDVLIYVLRSLIRLVSCKS